MGSFAVLPYMGLGAPPPSGAVLGTARIPDFKRTNGPYCAPALGAEGNIQLSKSAGTEEPLFRAPPVIDVPQSRGPRIPNTKGAPGGALETLLPESRLSPFRRSVC